MQFDSDKEKAKRLEMADKLVKKIFENKIIYSGKLFDSIVFTFTESQQWKQVIDLLSNINPTNCEPEVKTIQYLKKNLLYCFEPTIRS